MKEEERIPLSADHMIHKNSAGLAAAAGGDYSLSWAYLLSWQGPAAEADDPYGDHVSPEGLSPVCHVQTVKLLGEKDYDAIKRAVYETGGVQSSLYLPEVVKIIAEIKGISCEEVVVVTESNALRVFGLV